MNCYQDQNQWKHNLIPIQISKNESVKIIESLTKKNHYSLVKKINVLYKSRCENCDITTIGTSSDCHLH